MTAERPAGRVRHIMLNVGTGVVFLVIVVLLLMWLAGAFHRKIDDASAAAAEEIAVGRPIGDAVLVPVRRISVPRIEPAVGTIRAVHETSVASKLLAKVVELNVKAGQQVAKEEVLARLDDADLVARLEQAKANLVGATARRDQAQIEHDRVQRLIEQRAAAEIEMDRVRAALKSAEAQFDQAGQAVSEARTLLDYATIRSPIDGIVIDKKVEIGDTATPGQVLVTLYDPTRMQLVASVRESLTQRLSVGQAIRVRIDALDKVRGSKKALDRLVQLAVEKAGKRRVLVTLTHVRDVARMNELRKMAEKELNCDPDAIVVNETGPVIGSHVGPGTVGLGFCPAE